MRREWRINNNRQRGLYSTTVRSHVDLYTLKHRNGVISELMRIQFPMTFEDEIVAKWFGLETARILLDSSYRLFAIGRYQSEK